MKVFMLIAVLVALLAPAVVNASCGQCTDSHSCIGEREFQICFDGVRDQTVNYTCPDDSPICTDYGIICLANGTDTKRGCGDVSKCGICSGTDVFACTSLTTFAICNNGEVSASQLTCSNDYVCSVSKAGAGEPCITRCDSTDDDICDLIVDTDSSTTETTTISPNTTVTETSPNSTVTEPSTITTETTPNSTVTETSTITTVTATETISTTEGTGTTPSFNEVVYCQGISSMGRYPIPNDTACISYIYCILKGGNWAGLLYNCPTDRPFFDADIFNCGTVRPAYANCTNLS
ncbi:location of vulva defective 1 [Drosophila rhopaloa]|uniref:Chitin-binding type-2 domain-containing protein n=1 Tax=Drosophila rhopaloa TaxID=1041015 RepID=A0ABM5I7D3_DRORH|nr:location of vulva defective 1 [Drosophila rhopaloa]